MITKKKSKKPSILTTLKLTPQYPDIITQLGTISKLRNQQN